AVVEAAETLNRWQAIAGWAMVVVAVALMLVMAFVSYTRLHHRFRARTNVELFVTGFMIFCSVVAIVTTIGIIVSLVYESMQFFAHVPPHEFFFGLNWEPQIAIREDQVAG